jgi:hypothetical protein
VFKALVLARLIEPTSKLATIRALDEIGIPRPQLSDYQPAHAPLCDRWVAAAARGGVRRPGRAGPTTLVLYDVTTPYFETGEGDGFREPGFSKERRLEPQITVGLLTDVRLQSFTRYR